MVVGSSGWIANNFLRFNGNRDLFLNMINWLSAGRRPDLHPPQSSGRPPVNVQTLGQKHSAVFWLSIVIFPLVVVGSGMATWWKRR